MRVLRQAGALREERNPRVSLGAGFCRAVSQIWATEKKTLGTDELTSLLSRH
jgi:hypothetical protein